jgi:hypothetical protein
MAVIRIQFRNDRTHEPSTENYSRGGTGAMAETIDRLSGKGWQAEATPEYGFVFIRNGADRRLLMLTPRDPHSTGAQSFNPFQSET